MIDANSFRKRVERKARHDTQLSTIWSVVRRVQQLTSNPNSSTRELVKVISSDAVLTGRILRIVNSAAYGIPRKVESLDQAIIILGYNQLRSLCTSLAAIGNLSGRDGAFDRVSLWKHSFATAAASRTMQSRLAGSGESELFVSGLLSNIGRIIIDQFFKEEFNSIIEVANNEEIPLLKAEMKVLGVTHAEVGYWMALNWGLNNSVADAIRNHHGPVATPQSCTVNLAYTTAQAMQIGSPGDKTLCRLIPGCFKVLNLSPEKLTDLIENIDAEFETIDPLIKELTMSEEQDR